MGEKRAYHHLFALAWMDFLSGSGIDVEEEKDLSHRKQMLDLALVHSEGSTWPQQLPDGFEDHSTYNLVTFKSHHEALDDWALFEHLANFVNYRKQVNPSAEEMPPLGEFRLFAVCVRFPHNLAAQGVVLTRLRPGVYEWAVASLKVRVVVIHELPQQEGNALLHLFSAKKELLSYGKEHYRPRSTQTSTLLYQLFRAYQEDPDVTTKLDEFVRQSLDEILRSLPPEELRKRLSPEERLEGLPATERLKGLPATERLEGLSAEELQEVMKEAQRRLQTNGPSSKPQ